MYYLVENISTFSQTLQALLEQRHFFLGAGPEYVFQGFQITFLFILPEMRVGNGNAYGNPYQTLRASQMI